jgi:hypothetical protein
VGVDVMILYSVTLMMELLYGLQKAISKKQTNIIILTLVYYSIFETCFDAVGSSPSSVHDASLVIRLCPNMDPY